MKAALYIRVSTKEQAKKHSLEAQTKELKKYCQKKKIEIYKIYKDYKGGDLFEEREGLMNLLDDKNKFNIVLFTEWDRLTRDPDIKGYIKFELKKKNIKLVSINEPEKKSDYDELVEGILNLFARFETKRRLSRLKRGFKIAMEEKKIRCHRPNIKEKNPVLYKKIIQMRKEGLSYNKIAKEVNLSPSSVYYICHSVR